MLVSDETIICFLVPPMQKKARKLRVNIMIMVS